MREVSDVKEQVFSPDSWARRIRDDPKRIYAFLLCSDEHEEFCSFIQKAWRSLHAESGRYCDIFTLEPRNCSFDRFHSPEYLSIPDVTRSGIKDWGHPSSWYHRKYWRDKTALEMVFARVLSACGKLGISELCLNVSMRQAERLHELERQT